MSLEVDVPRLPPVDVVVAVLGLALIEPVAFVDVPVPVVALGLVDIEPLVDVPDVVDEDMPESVRPVLVEVEVLPVAPGLAEPVPPIEVPVADVPLEPVPLLPPLPVPAPAPPPAWARATLPARPMMHRAAVAKVDLAFMCVS